MTPTSDGPLSISVTSIDQAGNRSPVNDYRFWVRTTAPAIDGEWPQLGKPTEFTFTAKQEGAVGFTYRLDGGPENALPLGPDGTARTTITITEHEPMHHELLVWTTNAAGLKSGIARNSFNVDPLEPTVSVDPWEGVIGQERTFTFTARMPATVSFTYRIDSGPETTVSPSADGTAEVALTPTEAGWFTMYVFTTNRDGVRSGIGWETLAVDGAAPTVTSAEYREWAQSGGPGVSGTGFASSERTHQFQVKALTPVITSPQYPPDGSTGGRVGEPIEFTFTAALSGSTEFAYRLNLGQETVVPVGPDGTATITYTAESSHFLRLEVFSRTPEGIVSGTRDSTFYVRP